MYLAVNCVIALKIERLASASPLLPDQDVKKDLDPVATESEAKQRPRLRAIET